MLLDESCTPRLQQLLEYLLVFWKENRYSPSLREMGAHLGISSTNAVSEMLTKLLDLRLISKAPGVGRSAVITERGQQWLRRAHKRANRAARSGGTTQRRKSA